MARHVTDKVSFRYIEVDDYSEGWAASGAETLEELRLELERGACEGSTNFAVWDVAKEALHHVQVTIEVEHVRHAKSEVR